MNFPKGTSPDAEYEHWRETWSPPAKPVTALPGWAIVEFGPIANRGTIIHPTAVSYNAMVVSDGNQQRAHREGYLPTGTEIIFLGGDTSHFEVEGRNFHRVKRSKIEMYIPKEDEVAA